METKQINWYRIPVPKEELQKLSKRSNAKGLLQCCSFCVIFIVLAYSSYYLYMQNSWVWFGIIFYIYCTLASFMGPEAAVHELSHYTSFKNKRLNDFFYKLFCFISWSNWVHFRYSHRKHHQFTLNRGQDNEIIIDPMRFSILAIIWKFTIDFPKMIMTLKPCFYHFFGSTKADFFHWDEYELFAKDDPLRKKMIQWSRFMVIVHFSLMAIFIYFQQYILIAIVNFPIFLGTWLSRGCALLQHHGLPSNQNDWRKICYTFYPNFIIQYFYWNMNYHIEHHTYANIPFYNLKKLHKLMLFQEPKPFSGYFTGIMHILKIMLKQHKDPKYFYQQILPDAK